MDLVACFEIFYFSRFQILYCCAKFKDVRTFYWIQDPSFIVEILRIIYRKFPIICSYNDFQLKKTRLIIFFSIMEEDFSLLWKAFRSFRCGTIKYLKTRIFFCEKRHWVPLSQLMHNTKHCLLVFSAHRFSDMNSDLYTN